ncbi:pilus assembly protein TadG-related protein [Thioalkalivibrio thiocyanodenitrificans]|uniref:pilus assembly protein TadG-related protein n=1 Tax=Thioalkalivibrio thiocyanodenitrificans TaxID=243063 RepID=UPI00037F2650|nr:pilus assembly protein TadG-related protein [Thioalkalivibrio thiocyanodenitrificans]
MLHNHVSRHRFAASRPRQRGASIVLVAVSLVVLLGLGALTLDGGNLYVARNELQNASDAGALAGTRMLYLPDGSMVNAGANQIAHDAAIANSSQGTPVEVVSVQRGHWSFTTRTFTPNPSLEPVDLFNASTTELDLNLNFINAMEVITQRSATPVQAFLGSVFGFSGYSVSARAVAYIGFAGTLRPEDVDQPIAICSDAITDGNEFSCNVGRFIPDHSDTGGWTNFRHDDSGATNANELNQLICSSGNPDEMHFGDDIATNNGQVQSAFNSLYACWKEETEQERLWNLTLPVIDCSGGIAPSNPLVGAVNLNIVWIEDRGIANRIDDDAPWQMELPPLDGNDVSPGSWSNDDPDGTRRWDDFVETFNIRMPDGSHAYWSDDPQERGWKQKTIYFLPDCAPHEPIGRTGGENFGVLAQIPVLVD